MGKVVYLSVTNLGPFDGKTLSADLSTNAGDVFLSAPDIFYQARSGIEYILADNMISGTFRLMVLMENWQTARISPSVNLESGAQFSWDITTNTITRTDVPPAPIPDNGNGDGGFTFPDISGLFENKLLLYGGGAALAYLLFFRRRR